MLKPSPTPRPIPDAAYWKQLRECYFASKKGVLDEHDVKLKETFAKAGTQIDGSLVECEVRHGAYGRGLFSKKHIAQGTPVWSCHRYGVFTTRAQWERFLGSLPHHMQYDVVTWAYVMEWDEEFPQVVGLDLEPASLMVRVQVV